MFQTRMDLINFAIGCCGYTTYLEIGGAYGKCFNSVKRNGPLFKTAVEPDRTKTGIITKPLDRLFQMPSDTFFSSCNELFDIIFIDGDHSFDQTMKDFFNSVDHLSKDGMIIIHDCIPVYEVSGQRKTERYYDQDWRVIYCLKQCCGLQVMTGNFDKGCAVVKVNQSISIRERAKLKGFRNVPQWDRVPADLKQYLNLVLEDELQAWIEENWR